jgi:hypothetical protein
MSMKRSIALFYIANFRAYSWFSEDKSTRDKSILCGSAFSVGEKFMLVALIAFAQHGG